MRTARSLFTFPNPVNEYAARTVATGVVTMCVAAVSLDLPWLVVVVCLGFWARVLTGPTLSPLGQLATRVVAPRLPLEPRLVAGPPKRFAQGVGVAFSTTAAVLWVGLGLGLAGKVVLGALATAAFLEAAFGLCLGCKTFALLMRAGVFPPEVCESCADVTRRHPELASGAA
ncbi:MAG: DUF4395 domain-containing protein [Acidimicrobiales bacterium]